MSLLEEKAVVTVELLRQAVSAGAELADWKQWIFSGAFSSGAGLRPLLGKAVQVVRKCLELSQSESWSCFLLLRRKKKKKKRQPEVPGAGLWSGC